MLKDAYAHAMSRLNACLTPRVLQTQGTKSLTKYIHAFNNLSRYAPEFVNTEEKKIESFKHGLGTKLMKTMTNSRCATYNEFVSDAHTQEN